MGIAGIDIVFLLIIGLCFIRCAIKGFISELLSMAALIFGMVFAIFFFKNVAVLIRSWFMPEVKIVPEIIAFVVIFIIIYIIVKIIESTLKSIIEGINLGGLDRLLGAFLGIIEGIIVVCLVLFLLSIQPFFDPKPVLEKSIFAKILLPLIFGERKEVVESLEAIVLLGLTYKNNNPRRDAEAQRMEIYLPKARLDYTFSLIFNEKSMKDTFGLLTSNYIFASLRLCVRILRRVCGV
jgi:membrane protein required for colicin V production